jgi:hypothetical protein
MTTQHITCESPAAVGALDLIENDPGITTSEIARRGGWSVFHMRNVLRYLRKHGRLRSERHTEFSGECRWWLGKQELPAPAPVPRRAVKVTGPNSVFALGAQ